MSDKFSPYQPPYTLIERLKRISVITGATTKVAGHLIKRDGRKFAASVEVTDRCNAGCNYCYVYPPEWEQAQRVRGYMQLSPQEHRHQEQQVFKTLERLKAEGVIHVTVVGGEPALAGKIVQKAAESFPLVWVVTNGAAKLPPLPNSATVFVSIDGTAQHHNSSRDPQGYFSKHRYGDLTGMSAAIARNINESQRGAFVHITLTKSTISQLPSTVDWLVKDIKKLRGIVVSGAATKHISDPNTFSLEDKQLLKQLISQQCQKYGWKLFPFNQPLVNNFLFDPEYVIQDASSCSVAKRVESLNFNGESVGKCVLRDETSCETCVCNITGLATAIDRVHLPTIMGTVGACFG